MEFVVPPCITQPLSQSVILGIGKEAKFERGAAQVGPGIGLDFPLPLLQCMHNNPGG